jgi:hypothetical protein
MKKQISPRIPQDELDYWHANNLIWVMLSIRYNTYYIRELDLNSKARQYEKKYKT